MKKARVVFVLIVQISVTSWQPSFDKAEQVANQEHKMILLNFSGSDWCGPCIRLRKEFFESRVFSSMADSLLVLYDADFPRNKKNQPEKTVQKANETLADKYNASGKFPLTLLLDAGGKIIRTWDGLPTETAAQFTNEIRAIVTRR